MLAMFVSFTASYFEGLSHFLCVVFWLLNTSRNNNKTNPNMRGK